MENYQPPMTSAPPPPPPDLAKVQGMVNGPAIAIIVVAALAVLWGLVSLVLNLLGTAGGGLSSMMGGMSSSSVSSMMSGGIGIASALLSIGINGAAIFGALKLKNLENYNFAMAGAILVMLPCGCCCVLGLGAGIWAIVVLMKPEVKAAFRG